jgi:hypothetical protein
MRQFFTWQFWLAIVGLVAALGVALVVRDRASSSSGPDTGGVHRPSEHRIDVIAPVVESQPDAGFAIVDGAARGRLTLVLDAGRRVTILDGTRGESSCPLGEADTPSSCMFAADLLGDGVVWFSLVPAPQRATVDLPPIVELRDDGWTLLRNGWEVQRASSVERSCQADTTSLSDLVRRFGPTSVTTFNLDKQEIVKVSCGTG